MPTCSHCGAATGADDRFCMQCGRRLASGAPARDEAIPPGTATHAGVAPDPDATGVVARPQGPAGVELVACPSCGSSNAARRMQCARCGTGLHPAGEGPVEDRDEVDDDHDWLLVPPAAPPPDGARPRRGRRGAALAVIVVGMVVGTVLGLAAGMGVGPFQREEPVAFDTLAYPDEPTLRRPATAAASSTADPEGDRAFEPTQTVDDDLATAWRADDEGEGALVRHGYVAPVWVTRIEVATGDQADDTTFASVGRVTGALIDLGTLQVEATLAASDGVQVLRLPRPVLTDEITWEVTDVVGHPAAITEVRYIGWDADEEDREAYEER